MRKMFAITLLNHCCCCCFIFVRNPIVSKKINYNLLVTAVVQIIC